MKTIIREADYVYLADNGWLFFRPEASEACDLFNGKITQAKQVFCIKASLHRKDCLNLVIIPAEGAPSKSFAYAGNYTIQWKST